MIIKKKLALLPAYNESVHIEKVLNAVLEQINDVLVVDDGSTDNTADIVRSCGVNLLSRGYNCGKGQSLKDGYKWALENGYDAVIMLDADGQHDPKCIPDFIEKFITTNASLVIGARNYNEIPLRRRIPNMIGKVLFSAAVGQDIPDNQSGYRLLDRALMERMLTAEELRYHLVDPVIVKIVIELIMNFFNFAVAKVFVFKDKKSTTN